MKQISSSSTATSLLSILILLGPKTVASLPGQEGITFSVTTEIKITPQENTVAPIEFLPLTDTSIREAVSLWTSEEAEDRQIAKEFYGLIESWDTSRVTDMSRLFRNKINFNENITQWNVQQVTSMQLMFYGASSFTYDLSPWNLESTMNLGGMFVHASNYTHSLCWPMLSKFAFVEEMFCGGASGASLDPCCVEEELVKSACCGDACSAFCFETTTPSPTIAPTGKPTASPTTGAPTGTPTGKPTGNPTATPTTEEPSNGPTTLPATLEPTTSPTGEPTSSVPSVLPTDFPTTHQPSTAKTSLLPTDAPTNGTVLYTEPHITIVNFVPNITTPNNNEGFYNNDGPPTIMIPAEEPPQVSTSLRAEQGASLGSSSKDNSGWVGAIIGFVVGAVAIASIVVARRHYQNQRQRQALALFGKEYDNDHDGGVVEVPVEKSFDTLIEIPPDDEDEEDPAPKLQDMDISIEQRVQPSGVEAVELCYDNHKAHKNDFKDELVLDEEDGYNTGFEDSSLQLEEQGSILPRVELQEVGVFGKRKH